MEMQERWLPVVNYEGVYEVSDAGRIRRVGRAARTGNGRGGGARIGLILRHLIGSDGYPRVQLWRDGQYRNYLVHRLVATAFLANEAGLAVVNHLSGDKSDARASNLEWATSGENNSHAIANGLRTPVSKLSSDQVSEIKRIHRSGEGGCRRIAKRFGVAKATVQKILAGHNQKRFERCVHGA